VASGNPRFIEQAVVAMGRRDRTLLRRQASFVDQLQQRTSDTGSRTILDRLDEVSIRLQRNAENLLVLVGEKWPATDDAPVAVADVLAMGATVLDDRARITNGALDPVVIAAGAAADTAHLLAELLDNALTFSPPETAVEVGGRLTPDGYRLSITDHGIGIAALGLRTANRRLRPPLDVERSPENRLGLFVIGHLAARHDIVVELRTADIGLVAEVTLPLELIEAPPIEAAATTSAPPATAPLASTPAQPASTATQHAPAEPSIWPAAFSPVEEPRPSPAPSTPIGGHSG
jgi:K+-sensing histidine kinase KdpD